MEDCQSMKSSRTDYQSYLLRLWCEAEKGEWRASLEDVATGECHHFPNMSALLTFLNSQTMPLGPDISFGDWSLQNATETLKPAFYEYSEEEV